MEAIIKVSPSELDNNLLDKIKEFIGKKKNVDVTISLKEFDENYVNDLNQSIEDAEAGNFVASMTMEEFMAYPSKK